MIAIRMGDPQRPGAEVTRGLGQGVCRRERRAGDFEQNLRGKRQRAAHRHQSSARGYVQCGGKLQKILAFFVAATNENGDSDREARPLTPLSFRIRCSLQTDPFRREITPLPHLGGQTYQPGNAICRIKPASIPAIACKSVFGWVSRAGHILLLFAHAQALTLNFEALRTARFFPFVTSGLHFPLTLEKPCHTISTAPSLTVRLLSPLPSKPT